MRTIIAATDFTAASLNAVNYAADLAHMLGFRLIIFHVYSIPVPISEVPIPPYSAEELESEANHLSDNIKQKIQSRLGAGADIHIEIRPGDVMEELNDFCTEVEPYAVVVGAESAGAFERFLFGATTLEAVNRLRWPLLVVPPLVNFRNIHKIGLACDFRNVTASVRVREIKELIEAFKAELHVVHVTETGDFLNSVSIQQSAILKEMLDSIHPKFHIIEKPVVEDALLEFSREQQLDMLIIIPKKHNLLRKIIAHSSSRQLVLQTQIPLMSIHQNN